MRQSQSAADTRQPGKTIPIAVLHDPARKAFARAKPLVSLQTTVSCAFHKEGNSPTTLAWVKDKKKFDPSTRACRQCNHKEHCASVTVVRCSKTRRRGGGVGHTVITTAATKHVSSCGICQRCESGSRRCGAIKELGLVAN